MHRHFCIRTLLCLGIALSLAATAQAALKLHGLFTDNAVLQQGRKLAVSGTGEDGQQVLVTFRGVDATAQVNDGKWSVELPAQQSGGPFEMTVKSGDEELKLANLMVGEVWIASGQSNMQWPLSRSADPQATVAAARNPMLRLFTVPRRATVETQDDVVGRWEVCSPESVPEFSAVGYHFGQALQAKLGVPVGVISTNYGGTPAEAWTSKEKLAADETLKGILTNPTTENPHSPCGLYNAMIHPLLGYPIAGAIWYQGESNAGRAWQYRTLFPAMITNWRELWRQGDFPFLLVQLAPFKDIKTEPAESDWAELREAQRLATKVLPNVGMAVITDVGDPKDIHPQQKQPVGERLALAARAIGYGEKISFSGPDYYQHQVDGNRVVIEFQHADGGLVAKDGPLQGFTIAGADRKFVNAEAKIDGDRVIVSSPEVKEPVAVRFGWADYPVVNLWNGAGLPATPFRTDDFPVTTQPK